MALIKIKSESMNLADDYAFTGTVSGAGDPSLVRLGGGEASGVNVGDVSFDLFSSTYQMYVVYFRFSNLGGGESWLRLRTSSGYQTNGNYRYMMVGRDNAGTGYTFLASGDSKLKINENTVSSTQYDSCLGKAIFWNPTSTSKNTHVAVEANTHRSDGNFTHVRGGVEYQTAEAHVGFGFLGSISNFDEYNIQVYGVKES